MSITNLNAMKWRVANDGTGKYIYFLVRDESVPIDERYFKNERGNLRRFATSQAAQKLADQLNEAQQFPIREAATFLRNTVAGSPGFGDTFTVVNIESLGDQCLVFDLDDGSSIRVDIERYRRDDFDNERLQA